MRHRSAFCATLLRTAIPLLGTKRALASQTRYTQVVTRPVVLLALLFAAGMARAGELRATLVVNEDASGKTQALAGAPRRLPFVWHDSDDGKVAEIKTADGALSVELRRKETVLTVEAAWHKKAWVHLVALELELDGDAAQVVGRDLEPVLASTAYLERFDPKWVQISRGGRPETSVVVDDSVDGLLVKLLPQKRVLLRVELDAAEARPFMHDARCTTNWRAPNRHLGLPLRLRVADEKVSARVQILDGASVPLVKAHYPDGRRAALVVTDHADQSSARTLATLAEGLLRHHLPITKALFAHGYGARRPQLEDPAVGKLADEMAAGGSEIVPHSATPKPDLRSVTSAALDLFERWKTRTWIDHQPETNCEAFGDQGFHVGGKFGIADLLAAHQYQYVWAEDDAPAGELNLLLPKRLDKRAPTVWPTGRLDLGGPEGLWMFRTVWAFLEAKRFLALYAPAKLDQLEKERGLHIAHTYLETYHPKSTIFGRRNLLVPDGPKLHAGGPGGVKLDPRFDALLGALAMRQERGTLWVPTLGVLADRLRATADVTVTLLPDGSAVLHATQPVAGATFVVGKPGAGVLLDGKAPRGLRTEGDQTVFWDDLPAGDTTVRVTSAPGAETQLPLSMGAAKSAQN